MNEEQFEPKILAFICKSPFSILGDKVTLAPKPMHIKGEETANHSIALQEKN